MNMKLRTAQARPTLDETKKLIQLSVYVQGLRTFNWQYAYSAIDEICRQGEESLSVLRAQQQLCDPTGEIWRMLAPRGNGVPGPVVRDSIRGTLPLIGNEDPEDGCREYAVCFWRKDSAEVAEEITLWAHTGADAMREAYERYGLGITVVVQRRL